MSFKRLDAIAPYLALIASVAAFFIWLFPLLKPFPYTDDWTYLVAVTSNGPIDWRWIFAQHNDHRIPLQKFLHVMMLRITQGDFRSLVMLNVATSAVAALCWMQVARLLRDGRRSLGDAIIPLLFLSFGFNNVYWGFSFTFVLSISLASVCALAWVAHFRGVLRYGVEYAFLALTLCAWTGGNGILSSAVMGVALVLTGLTERARSPESWSVERTLAILLWALTLVGLVLTWTPSSASTTSASHIGSTFVPFLVGMSKSWMGVFAIQASHGKDWFAIALFLLAAAGATGLGWKYWRRRDSRYAEQLLLLAVLGQSAVTIVTVALSRSVVQPWTPGLELHYGYLALLIPVAAWLVISCWCRHPVAERTAAVVVLALVAYMYQANSSWRIATSRQAYPVVVAAELALMGAAPPLQVAGDHMSEFYYVDTPEARGSVANDIVVLRRLPLWHADGTVQP